MKKGIKFKIVAAFLTVIAVLSISEAFFFAMHFAVVKRYQNITDNMVSEYRLIGNASDLVDSFHQLIQYANDQQRKDVYDNNLAVLQALLAKLDKNITNGDSWTVYLGVKSTINGVIDETKKGVAAILSGNFSEVTVYYLKASQKNGFVKDNAANLILKELSYVEKLQADIVKIQSWSEIIGLILFFAVIFGCLGYSLYFAQRLISPLLKLTKFAKAVSGGNLEIGLDESLKKGGDEAASLANYFSATVSSLQDNIKKLKEGNAQLVKIKKTVLSQKLQIDELNETNNLKNEFLNIATHELRKSLIPIFDLSETMERKKEIFPPECQKYVTVLHEEGVKLDHLIRQMLQSASSERATEKETFYLDGLIASAETSLNALAEKTDSKIVFQFQDRGVGINSNKEKIYQIIYNFVDNAVKYGPNGQTITVALMRADQEAVRVEVSDEGPGIPQELQDKLFLKFFQPESSSPSREGMGLGLYICKRNAEMLGGEIGVANGGKKGAIFHLTIPLLVSEKKIEET